MTRTAALAFLALLLQEPPPDFQKLLESAEKLGLAVPELPEAVAKLEALAHDARLPADSGHRLQTLRALSAVLSRVHVRLALSIDKTVEMPDAQGKPIPMKILELKKTGVRVARPEGEMQLTWGDLNAEWAAAWVREDLASSPDAGLLVGLWLAKAERWDAAFRELGDAPSDHPLAVEARRRGLGSLLKQIESAANQKRWKEAIENLKFASKIAAEDPAVVGTRRKVLEALVDQGREASRKGNRKAVDEIIAWISAHFPNSDDAVQDIRDETRWISITDPAKFGLAGKDGEPILMNAGDEPVDVVRAADLKGSFDGFSVRIRFSKVPKQSHGGPNWDRGEFHAWVIRDSPFFIFARHDDVRSQWNELASADVAASDTYEIRVVIDKGDYVCSVNGVVTCRAMAKSPEIRSPGVQASHGRLMFDRFRLRKRK